MKKNYILLLLLCLCFAGCKEKTVVESDYLPIADPYVMLYEGKYYAYGTGGTVEGEGFACFSSRSPLILWSSTLPPSFIQF